jgi:two-component system, chemotaxis family, protein-glutamate methylesterase/glutaminase
MAPIRVLVVEDSPTVRHHIQDVLSSDPDVEVAGVAGDGRTAIELTVRTRPDVITMDLMLPGVSGLAATEYIMAHHPTPILVVSSADNRAEMFTTCDALAAGAVDVLDKPSGTETDAGWEQRLRAAVKLLARVPVITHPRARLSPLLQGVSPPGSHYPAANAHPVANPTAGPATVANHRVTPLAVPGEPGGARRCAIVAIGASTGGPGAVVDLLRALPRDFTLPILVVQHISAPFAATFVDWLGGQVGRRAVAASDGDPVAAGNGRVLMAPPDRHLVVRNGRLRLTDDPERHSCRPSIDTLLESVAREYGDLAAGCVLTGMGRDGAAGLLALRRAGGLTFAQDEATSVVYGMPREAVALGAAQTVLPPAEIGRRLAGLRRQDADQGRVGRR